MPRTCLIPWKSSGNPPWYCQVASAVICFDQRRIAAEFTELTRRGVTSGENCGELVQGLASWRPIPQRILANCGFSNVESIRRFRRSVPRGLLDIPPWSGPDKSTYSGRKFHLAHLRAQSAPCKMTITRAHVLGNADRGFALGQFLVPIRWPGKLGVEEEMLARCAPWWLVIYRCECADHHRIKVVTL